MVKSDRHTESVKIGHKWLTMSRSDIVAYLFSIFIAKLYGGTLDILDTFIYIFHLTVVFKTRKIDVCN